MNNFEHCMLIFTRKAQLLKDAVHDNDLAFLKKFVVCLSVL